MAGEIKCIVCGTFITDAAEVDRGGYPPKEAVERGLIAATKAFHEGSWYYCCTLGCRARFVQAPEAYLPTSV